MTVLRRAGTVRHHAPSYRSRPAAIHHRITHPDAVAPVYSVSTACVSINTSNHSIENTLMPIILEATYSKKLGLPNHGSHSYVVSVRTDLADIEQMPDESNRLYRMPFHFPGLTQLRVA